jgi:transposase
MTISTDVDKLYDTDLSDAAWALIAPMLPAALPGGRPRKINIRAVLNAIFYLRRTGCQWRLLPREFPGWSTVYHYLPGLEERWGLDLYPALNVPASSKASRPGRLSFSRHYGRSVGKDNGTRRHSVIRCAQARERTQAPHPGGHVRVADRMQSGAG